MNPLIIIKKQYRIILSLLACTIFFISCDPLGDDPPIYPKKSKTILVYMAANNNLSGNAFENIQELESGFVPTADFGNLIVYSHTYNAKPKLLKIYKNSEGKVVRDTVYNFPDMNSAMASSLTSVIKIVTTMYPAEENGLILWSHATGWLPTGYYAEGAFPSTLSGRLESEKYSSTSNRMWPNPQGVDPYAHLVKSFGADNGKNVEIEISDLVKALPHKFSFVIFDACLMGGIETAYQLKDSTDYIVFSPTEVIADGYCYTGMMEHLFKSPTDLTGMAKNVYDYYNSMSGESKSATIAVVKCSELNAVADAAKIVFDKYRQNIPNLNINGIQRYFRMDKHWFYDINDFISQLSGSEGAVHAAAFKTALDKAVIYKAATSKFIDLKIDPNKFSGISIYIPNNPIDEKLLEFYRKSYTWESAVWMTTK